MSKNEILQELSKLTLEDRLQIRAKLDELEGRVDDGWGDDGDLTDEQKRIIETRLEELKRDPSIAVPWEQVKAELPQWFGK